MEDVDDDTEVADYGTDDADGVDPNYDAEARPQQDPLSKYVHADPLQAQAHAHAPGNFDGVFADLQPESKTAFAHASEEPTHRSGRRSEGRRDHTVRLVVSAMSGSA